MAEGPPDPGGQFASDLHRRVAGHLPGPKDALYRAHKSVDLAGTVTVGDLLIRLAPDPHTPVGMEDEEELHDVLMDLEADGLVSLKNDEWKLTKEGAELLNGPIANEPEEVSANGADSAEVDPA